MSALDRAVEALRWAATTMNPDDTDTAIADADAARAKLIALRKRVEDLELMQQ